MGEIDDETRWVAQAELNSIDRLIISWNGKEWPYKGGLLSGWRITSLVGTMVSMAIGRYIIQKNNIPGARAVGMGDDIILASPLYGLTQEQLFDSYAETGFNINLLKTISGPIGSIEELEVPGVDREEKADALAGKLRIVLSEEVLVGKPVKCADLLIRDLDDSVTERTLQWRWLSWVGARSKRSSRGRL
ncbi:unnamed protein product [Pieris macdunnoughi]|uniref:RNA-directed RNA polymerase n=1 Tax=Pieris macdunnoughi TaxID=345717 RepID=A0A821UH22_9NEOP|nr:unnamed protein product [Pieris macdunnoughi]